MNQNQVQIRPYQSPDEPVVLELMDLNTPRWFAPLERTAFVKYLAYEREAYFVLVKDGKVVGCGGINYLLDQAVARISWDILHPDFQGQGLGSQLLQYRLGLLRTNPNLTRAIVRTSQFAHLYYQKNGFQLVKMVVDYWAPGFDLYEMEQSV